MCDYCSWIDCVLAKAKVKLLQIEDTEEEEPKGNPVIIIHGGAKTIAAVNRVRDLIEVKYAAIETYRRLLQECKAVDAVECAIKYLETRSNPYDLYHQGLITFNYVETIGHAGLMDGLMNAGCVGAVKNYTNPIVLAKHVMLETDHVLIVDSGAIKLVTNLTPSSQSYTDIDMKPLSKACFEKLSKDWRCLVTDEEEEEEEEEEYDEIEEPKRGPCQWSNTPSETSKEVLNNQEEIEIPPSNIYSSYEREEEEEHVEHVEEEEEDTVPNLQIDVCGAVAFDQSFNWACGTSSFELKKNKTICGTLGSTGTVLGCGIYANKNGGTSVSGNEKLLYAEAPARTIVSGLLDEEIGIDEVLRNAIEKYVNSTLCPNIGAIAVDKNGSPGVHFEAESFPWAYCHNGMVHFGSFKGKRYSQKIKNLPQFNFK